MGESTVWAVAWAFLKSTIPAAIGALISLRFMPADSSFMQRLAALGSAYLIGTYMGRAVVEYFAIKNVHLADAVLLMVALFGLAIAGNLLSEVKPMITAARLRLIGPAEPTKPEQKP